MCLASCWTADEWTVQNWLGTRQQSSRPGLIPRPYRTQGLIKRLPDTFRGVSCVT